MKFEIRHTFEAEMAAVEAALLDPELPAYLKQHMKLVTEIVPLERTEDGDRVRRRVRYVPVPLIKRIGPKEVPPGAMAWVEESSYDRRMHRMEFRNISEHPKLRALLDNAGTLTLRDLGAGRTERVVAGELRVKVTLLGRIAEKIIHGEAEKILGEEARVLADYVKARASKG
jgi:hypothetical protein